MADQPAPAPPPPDKVDPLPPSVFIPEKRGGGVAGAATKERSSG